MPDIFVVIGDLALYWTGVQIFMEYLLLTGIVFGKLIIVIKRIIGLKYLRSGLVKNCSTVNDKGD
jgi:hypothetical protein